MISARDDAGIHDALQRIIEQFPGGEVTILHYVPLHDSRGRVTAYKVWVKR